MKQPALKRPVLKHLLGALALPLAALLTACELILPPLVMPPPTAVPPTAIPPTAVPPTAVPPATIPPTLEPTAPPPTPIAPVRFDLQVLSTDLAQPWEIAYGPDDHLWITERMGKRVVRLNPIDGQRSTALVIDEVYANLSQEGLLGMVLHPELLQGTGQDYVYLAYTYSVGNSEGTSEDGEPDTRLKIRRYRYEGGLLIEPFDLMTDLPASIDHNGGRLTLGPDNKLYYPIGDQGSNNFTNLCLPNGAQVLPTLADIAANNWQHYVGKILRLNLDGSIPADNPTWDGVQSHVFSVGHRNVQGMAAGNGQLYATEHGPKTDDEVNHIVAGYNYGWPHVAGYQDDLAYIYADWSSASPPCSTLEYSSTQIPAAVPKQLESEWSHPAFMPPLYTFGTVSNDYNFVNQACDPAFYICWPTIAPAGMDFYAEGDHLSPDSGIPGWTDSLLVAALKTGTIYRLPLADVDSAESSSGRAVVGQPLPLFKTTNRYRDLAIAPDGRTFYIVTDSSGPTQNPLGLPTDALDHPGAVLVFTFANEP